MIRKTEGIVLRTIRHQDTNLITTIYTRDYGIRSFVISGYRSSRSRQKHSYFQPLSIIDIVYFHRENRGLDKINESKVSTLLMEIQTDPVKLSLGLAILEIFYDTVKEQEENLPLYNFLKDAILLIEKSEKRLIQIFIFFLLHHTRYLGFFPSDMSNASKKVEFDIRHGRFKSKEGQNDDIAVLLRQFAYSKLVPLPEKTSCQQIIFGQNSKKFLIKTLFEYYQFHIEGFRYPQTMKVFAEVFGT